MAVVSKSTKEMAVHIHDLSQQYERELLSILESLKPQSPSPVVDGKLDAQKKRAKIPKRKSGTRPLSRKEKQLIKELAEMSESSQTNSDIPPWAKGLYRSFMKTYHPDKIKDETLLEEVRNINNMYQNEEYEYMLCKCAEFDVFTDRLSFGKQKAIIQSISVRHANRISELQQGVAWQWGTVISESREATINLLKILCQKNGFPPPPIEKIDSVLKTFDIF